jgi:glutathione synthase/RimK-type ligase-like ATP-grasp enzyme
MMYMHLRMIGAGRMMRTVGILVDASVFRGITRGRTRKEKLDLYNRAAARHALTPVYLCLEQTFPSEGRAYGYIYAHGEYKYALTSIPRVIHNRTFPANKAMSKRLKLLAKMSRVFNGKNRYSKYRIYRLLKKRFSSYLPATAKYTKLNLRRMMKHYKSLYIKPQSGSIGKGIIKATRRQGGTWKLQLPNGSLAVSREQAVQRIHRIAGQKKYLIQETINLAKYKGSPFDIRVSVQRGADGKWGVTGMYAKVARKGSHLTNVARRGTAKTCASVMSQSVKSPDKAIRTAKKLSLQIARYLGKKLDRLADIGLDIGVDAEGKPYFIEMNGRDQRYGFKKANMNKTFYRTYETPLLYAKYLLKSAKLNGRG